MRILALPRYGRLGASSRTRFMQYMPWLEAEKIEVEFCSLFPDSYVAGLQQNRRDWWEVFQSYTRRLMSLLRSREFDLLWIEKELLPWLPFWLEHFLLSARVPYVLDYDDAVYHYYDQHRHSIVRKILARKHPQLMRHASLVIVGNAYLAEFARSASSHRVEVLPTAVDLNRYCLERERLSESDGSIPCVGWIGQRATARYLEPFVSMFKQFTDLGKARFAAIGIDTQAMGLPMESVVWNEQSEADSIRRFDIGIMPLTDAPLERGKCGYKLIQYMACGLPVVASPVGVNTQIVRHGINGFLADTPDEWRAALETLLTDTALRRQMGRAGRAMVEKEYCIQVTGPKLVDLLNAIGSDRQRA